MINLNHHIAIPIRHIETDFTADLALYHMQIGLSKIHHVLESAQLGSDVAFIPTPDISLTSNRQRWISGFSYGGILLWNSSRHIIFPQIRPNCCGVLLGYVPCEISIPGFLNNLCRARELFEADWDYDSGNHFIAVYEAADGAYFVIHGGGGFAKAPSQSFPGLYPEYSTWIRDRSRYFGTPWGPISVLLDEDADDYLRLYRRAENHVKAKRSDIASILFPDYNALFHETHQGLHEQNTFVLGAYILNSAPTHIPIMVSLGSNLLIIRSGWPISKAQCNTDEEQATLNRLLRSKDWLISPHASGDCLLGVKEIEYPVDQHEPMYCITLANGARVFSDHPGTLPTGWRPRDKITAAFARLEINVALELNHILTVR